MSINIFSLEFCQPLVWVALALVALLGILHLSYGDEILGSSSSSNSLLSGRKWGKLFYLFVLAAVTVLWLVVVIANHQTVWYDVVNFAFLVGFSFICAALVYYASLFFLVIFLIIAVARNRGTYIDLVD